MRASTRVWFGSACIAAAPVLVLLLHWGAVAYIPDLALARAASEARDPMQASTAMAGELRRCMMAEKLGDGDLATAPMTIRSFENDVGFLATTRTACDGVTCVVTASAFFPHRGVPDHCAVHRKRGRITRGRAGGLRGWFPGDADPT